MGLQEGIQVDLAESYPGQVPCLHLVEAIEEGLSLQIHLHKALGVAWTHLLVDRSIAPQPVEGVGDAEEAL